MLNFVAGDRLERLKFLQLQSVLLLVLVWNCPPGLDLGLEIFGLSLGLEDLWPWPRIPLALALTLTLKTTGIGLENAVLEHIPDF